MRLSRIEIERSRLVRWGTTASRLARGHRVGGHVDAADRRAPLVGPDARREHADGRRLARAVGPEQAEHLTGPDAERDPVDRVDRRLRIALDQLGDFDGCGHRLQASVQAMRAIDVRHMGREKVICAWEVDGVIVDPGPQSCKETLLDGARRRAPAGAAAHPHPLRPRGRAGRAAAALARPAGLRARARRAAHARPGAAGGQRRAAVRRRGGPAAALGRGRAGAGGEPARARGRRARRRGRLPRRVHARPRLAPRLLPARAVAAGRSWATWRGVRIPPHDLTRRADAAAGHRRRGVGALAGPRSPAGSPRRSRSPTSARPRTPPRSSSACREALRLPGASWSAEHDQEGFVAALPRPRARARPVPTPSRAPGRSARPALPRPGSVAAASGYPRGHERADSRAPADRRPRQRPGRQLAGDRPQRRPQHVRPRRRTRWPARSRA